MTEMTGTRVLHPDGDRVSTTDRSALEVANDIHRAAVYLAVRGAAWRRLARALRRDRWATRVEWFLLGAFATAVAGGWLG